MQRIVLKATLINVGRRFIIRFTDLVSVRISPAVSSEISINSSEPPGVLVAVSTRSLDCR